MKPWATARAVSVCALLLNVFRQKGRTHVNVIEQCNLTGFLSGAIQPLVIARAMWQAAASREQKHKRQEHRNIQGDGAERVTPKSAAHGVSQPCFPVVFGPTALVTKPKATSQHVAAVRTNLITNLNGLQALFTIRWFGALTLLHIEVKKRLKAAGENLRFALSGAPKCSDYAPAAIKRGLYQCTSATHPLAGPLNQRKPEML
jgi:hypothetical protein